MSKGCCSVQTTPTISFKVREEEGGGPGTRKDEDSVVKGGLERRAGKGGQVKEDADGG